MREAELTAYILDLIANKPSIAISQICRTVNDRGLMYCVKKSCYANPRKKKKWGYRKNACKYTQAKVRAIVKNLEAEGKIRIIFGKYTDPRSPRGYDFMKGCYLPGDVPAEPPAADLRVILDSEESPP